MPDIFDPRDRREIFLNGIKAGDASGLPDPQTREEMYLAAIAAKSLPEFPDADGTYVLSLTISDGDATLEWVSA
ncbi:MAG: hypothetical protein J6V94_05125 [Lachnospiraceae bacterium]|nr:hypothetical protein [Lachnospiraceae bacterium]